MMNRFERYVGAQQGMAARPLRGRLILYSTSSPLVQSTCISWLILAVKFGVGHANRCAIEVFVCAVPDAVLTLVAEHWDGWLKDRKPVPLTIRLLRFTAFGKSHLPDFRSVDAAWSLTANGTPESVPDTVMPSDDVFPDNLMFFVLPSAYFRVADDRRFFVMFHWGPRNGSGWRCSIREDGTVDAQNKWIA